MSSKPAVRACVVAGLALLALFVQGCDKVPYSYLGKFPGVAGNTDFEVTAVMFELPTPFPAGTLQMSGQYTPLTPGGLPSTLQVFIRKTQPNGTIVDQVTVNLTIRPDGVIPNQLVATPGTTLDPGQELRFVFRPVNTSLPFGQLKLKLLYEKS